VEKEGKVVKQSFFAIFLKTNRLNAASSVLRSMFSLGESEPIEIPSKTRTISRVIPDKVNY